MDLYMDRHSLERVKKKKKHRLVLCDLKCEELNNKIYEERRQC